MAVWQAIPAHGLCQDGAMIRVEIEDSGSLYDGYELTEAAQELIVCSCAASLSGEERRVAIYV
jgi:hypothetical protein